MDINVNAKMSSSPEVVLSDPLVTTNLVTGKILFNPTGLLEKLQQTIVKEYARRRWVQVRCESEKKIVLENLGKMSQANLSDEVLGYILEVVVFLGGLIAVAHLKPPTFRRCLALTRELLQSQGKHKLHEAVLKVLGCAHIDREQVEFHLQECANAFDRAVEVKRTPFHWLEFFVHPHFRPYLVEGAQEMINEGNHREAMSWIAFFHLFANATIQNDASDEEKPQYQSGFNRLLSELGLRTPSDWQSRSQLAESVAKEVFQLVDKVVENHPDIKV